MICPACQRSAQKSKVYVHGSYTTAAHHPGYYDEDGRYHNHDPNLTTTAYRCTKGHEWTTVAGGKCWCGWNANPAPEEKRNRPTLVS